MESVFDYDARLSAEGSVQGEAPLHGGQSRSSQRRAPPRAVSGASADSFVAHHVDPWWQEWGTIIGQQRSISRTDSANAPPLQRERSRLRSLAVSGLGPRGGDGVCLRVALCPTAHTGAAAAPARRSPTARWMDPSADDGISTPASCAVAWQLPRERVPRCRRLPPPPCFQEKSVQGPTDSLRRRVKSVVRPAQPKALGNRLWDSVMEQLMPPEVRGRRGVARGARAVVGRAMETLRGLRQL